MAIEDPAAARWGVQFHPESILTASGRAGHQIIGNVLDLCRARADRHAHGLLTADSPVT
jgi:anthranilate synthase